MARSAIPPFVRLDGAHSSLVLDCRGDAPAILYWGPRLSADATGDMLALLASREEAPGSPAVEVPLSLTPLAGAGFPGRPGLQAHRDGTGWASWTGIETVERGEGAVLIRSRDAANALTITHRLGLSPDGDVVQAGTEIVNDGDAALTVDWCAAPAIPLPPSATRLIGVEGRWAGEFQLCEQPFGAGGLVRENRRGRTSHDAFPGLIATEESCGELTGEAYGFHLGWSGNHRIAAERLSDGRAQVQMGELFFPGELRLPPGGRYRSPELFAAFSAEGLGGIARAFHRHLRARPEHRRLAVKPRPVHYNTWEAVYFDHHPDALNALVDAAADVGVERFVLDDGWFPGRRHDRAGLGDWEVDRGVYPDGLAPLIAHVESRGMEFGLWVEPEMVNADSALYRAHPDWVLATPPAPPVPFRHQMALDFGRRDVRDHILERMDALLRVNRIAYLKWDMNRDLSQPGGADGRAAAHAHVLGLYEMLDRLRAMHPAVEIESCASGGGRADFGILERTDRVWTSDSNDALDRLSIQRGFGLFMPPELMGAHIGPAVGHITGRATPLAMRAAVALFGHLGLEMDLRTLSADDRDALRAAIDLHKRHRALLHGGEAYPLPTPPGEHALGVVAPDGSEALFAHYTVVEPRGFFPGRLRLAGLDRRARYHVRLAWPEPPAEEPSRAPSPLVSALRAGVDLAGDALMAVGLQLPRARPESALVLHLRKVG